MTQPSTAGDGGGAHGDDENRRDFLYLATGAVTVVGTAVAVWPLIDNMNPSADVLAVESIVIDLSSIEQGQSVTVVWRKKPIFIRRRTAVEIEEARSVDLDDLKDPEADETRVQRPEWLVLVGICTHLGCIPLGQRPNDGRGKYGGWFCPCHGSHYDTSGRIRQGPAPKNLVVPPYVFRTDTTIKIG